MSNRKKPQGNKGNFLPFWEFFQLFVRLNALELPLKDLHREACDLLQRAVLGQLCGAGIEFIIINIPPRVGKTKIMEALAVWILTYFPDAQIIYTSYAGELAAASSRYIQEVMSSGWYMKLYPVRLGSVQQADHFNTTQGGQLHAEGVNGSLTGKGGGLKRIAGGVIIIDDPAKPDESLSLVQAEKIRFWFENTVKSRRNSSDKTPIVICAQRISSVDLPGFIMENYPGSFVQIKQAALVNGESIIPETVSTKSLLDTQRVNPFTFAAQYQQEPIILGGNLIKTDDFFLFDDPNMKWKKKVITVDTAMRTEQYNDYSVAQCWGLLDHKAYLIDQIRGKWESPTLLSNVATFFHLHNRKGGPFSQPSSVRKILIEEKSAGIGLIQQLRQLGVPAVGTPARTKDKPTRVQEILPYIVTKMVGIYSKGPWLKDLLNECAEFRPDGKSPHDDQVDALCDGIWELLGKSTSILDVIYSNAKRQAPAGMQPIDACGPRVITPGAFRAPIQTIAAVMGVDGIYEAEVPPGSEFSS